jgi:hypothetical protein
MAALTAFRCDGFKFFAYDDIAWSILWSFFQLIGVDANEFTEEEETNPSKLL